MVPGLRLRPLDEVHYLDYMAKTYNRRHIKAILLNILPHHEKLFNTLMGPEGRTTVSIRAPAKTRPEISAKCLSAQGYFPVEAKAETTRSPETASRPTVKSYLVSGPDFCPCGESYE